MKKTAVPALILSAICLVIALLVVLTNEVTKDRIAAVTRETMEKAAKSVLSEATELVPIEIEGITGYIGKDAEGNIVGYTFETSAKGYGGKVTSVVGMSVDGVITGVYVTAPDETPGLGANVTKDSFLSRFVGKTYKDGFVLKENITAVTGATYSSRAVTEGVRLAAEQYRTVTESLKKGEGA
jgi:electron transport complex protein RnfG